MIDEDLLKEATEYMLKNSHHKEEYKNAPSKHVRNILNWHTLVHIVIVESCTIKSWRTIFLKNAL